MASPAPEPSPARQDEAGSSAPALDQAGPQPDLQQPTVADSDQQAPDQQASEQQAQQEDQQKPPKEGENGSEEAENKEGGEEENDDEDEDEDEEDDIKVTIEDFTAENKPATIQKQPQQVKQAAPAILEANQSIVDINTLDDKPWRMPGADINDYFNYGFDEPTWKLYCEKQKKMKNIVNELVETHTETYRIPVVGHSYQIPVVPSVIQPVDMQPTREQQMRDLTPLVEQQPHSGRSRRGEHQQPPPSSSSSASRSKRDHRDREVSSHRHSRERDSRKHESSRSRKDSKSRDKRRRSRSREIDDRRSKRHKSSRRS